MKDKRQHKELTHHMLAPITSDKEIDDYQICELSCKECGYSVDCLEYYCFIAGDHFHIICCPIKSCNTCHDLYNVYHCGDHI